MQKKKKISFFEPENLTTISIVFFYSMKRIFFFFNGLVSVTTLRGKEIQKKTFLKINQ